MAPGPVCVSRMPVVRALIRKRSVLLSSSAFPSLGRLPKRSKGGRKLIRGRGSSPLPAGSPGQKGHGVTRWVPALTAPSARIPDRGRRRCAPRLAPTLQPVERGQHPFAVVNLARQAALAQGLAEVAGVRREQISLPSNLTRSDWCHSGQAKAAASRRRSLVTRSRMDFA